MIYGFKNAKSAQRAIKMPPGRIHWTHLVSEPIKKTVTKFQQATEPNTNWEAHKEAAVDVFCKNKLYFTLLHLQQNWFIYCKINNELWNKTELSVHWNLLFSNSVSIYNFLYYHMNCFYLYCNEAPHLWGHCTEAPLEAYLHTLGLFKYNAMITH